MKRKKMFLIVGIIVMVMLLAGAGIFAFHHGHGATHLDGTYRIVLAF